MQELMHRATQKMTIMHEEHIVQDSVYKDRAAAHLSVKLKK